MVWSGLRQNLKLLWKFHQNQTYFDCFREDLKLGVGWGDHQQSSIIALRRAKQKFLLLLIIPFILSWRSRVWIFRCLNFRNKIFVSVEAVVTRKWGGIISIFNTDINVCLLLAHQETPGNSFSLALSIYFFIIYTNITLQLDCTRNVEKEIIWK